jgi:hypothetical protein
MFVYCLGSNVERQVIYIGQLANNSANNSHWTTCQQFTLIILGNHQSMATCQQLSLQSAHQSKEAHTKEAHEEM